MKTEIRTAIITGIIVIGIVIGIAGYFMLLEKPQVDKNNNLSALPQNKSQTSSDESRYPLAPDLIGIADYVNTTPDELKSAMKDKVVIYDFWTYSCINCIRTFPYLKAWNEKYADTGLLIIGIHSPEFEFEKDIKNVKMATEKYGLKYPVVLDNDHQTWQAFGNNYWPAEYITDSLGHIRHTHFGEGEYDQTEKVIQRLLDERAQRLGLNLNADVGVLNIKEHEFSNQQTPELYFGYNFSPGRDFIGNSEGFKPEKVVSYLLPSNLKQDRFYLVGQWKNFPDRMQTVSDNGTIILPYYAKDVHIVAAGSDTDIQILLDGKAITANNSGLDVKNGTAHISEHRLYNIVSSEQAGSHILTIIAHQGFQIYTFTFG